MPSNKQSTVSKIADMFKHWLDSDYNPSGIDPKEARQLEDKVDWERCIPFIILHLGLVFLIWVGWSPTAVIAALICYVLRMFAITGFYHRYFSHRTFKTGRVMLHGVTLRCNAERSGGQRIIAITISTQILKKTFTLLACRVSGGHTSAGSHVRKISLQTMLESKIYRNTRS